jgi:hypothetical protein
VLRAVAGSLVLALVASALLLTVLEAQAAVLLGPAPADGRALAAARAFAAVWVPCVAIWIAGEALVRAASGRGRR